MKLGILEFIISLVVAFCCGLGCLYLWKYKSTQSTVAMTETVISDLNDFRIMLYMKKEREYLLSSRGEVFAIDYADKEERYAHNWGKVRGGLDELLLLHPNSASGLYYIYRDFFYVILKAKSGDRDVRLLTREVQFFIAIIGSSMKLALQENNLSMYDALLDTQNCLLSEVMEGDLLTYETNCFPDLKARTYSELGLN